MKKTKTGIFMLSTLLLVSYTLTYDGPDPAYFKAFGYGSIAASIGGRPSFDQFNPAQYDYKDGIFYIESTAERLDLRALLPEGQTYGSMMSALFKAKASQLKDKKKEAIYWYAWSSHEYDGTRKYPEWKKGSPHPDYHDKTVWRESINYEPAKTWISSAAYFEDEETDFRTDVVNTWLKMAKPGMQLYILNTVGFERWVKDAAYWDYEQGKTVTPLEFVMSDAHFAYCILQIK